MRISRSVIPICGVVLAAALIGFTNPKAVHAVTAALVEVTNTPMNPVVTQGVGPQAGQIVHLHCGVAITGPISFSGVYWCGLTDSSGLTATAYVVPANESLVLTSVDISPVEGSISPTCTSLHQDRLGLTKLSGDVRYPQDWIVNNLGVHDSYPSGIVVGPGLSAFTLQFGFDTSICNEGGLLDTYDLYGYLTPA